MTDFILWQCTGLVAALFINPFVEWAVHRFVMHKRNPIIPYGYLHTTSHHATFGPGITYHAIRPEMLERGIRFEWSEYILFPLLCLFLYGPFELLTGKPTTSGAIVAVYLGLIAFDFLHARFHVPADTWVQRTWVFRFLKEHHRIHHADMTCNFNVVVPLADLCLGTLRMRG